MATIARLTLMPTPYSTARIRLKAIPDLSSSRFSKSSFIHNYQTSPSQFKLSCTLFPNAIANVTGKKVTPIIEKILQVRSVEELDEALLSAENTLVIVQFVVFGRKMYNSMLKPVADFDDIVFITVIVDESEKIRRLCRRENVEKIPYFILYKSMEKIHEEKSGFDPETLVNNILYYGDHNHSLIIQLQSKQELEKLVKHHDEVDDKLVVINVGLKKQCGPCAKVYRTVLKLSSQMINSTVFARINGDENESCMEFLKEMNVVKVPTFFIFRNGGLCGSYVGSCRSRLVNEIAKYRS